MNLTLDLPRDTVALTNPAKPLVYSAKRLKSTFGFTTLLTPDGYNPKTKKGRARGYSTAIMHFAPAQIGGYEVCQYRTAGCTASCLHTAGHAGIIKRGETTNNIQTARIARKKAFFQQRAAFNDALVHHITAHIRRARKNGLTPTVRLNGTSDMPFETLKLNDGRTVLETFPDIQFYDYTKNPKRAIANAKGEHPANYHLTFSLAESNREHAGAVLAAGGNVAAVFAICDCKRACKHEIPEGMTYAGRRVINGDADDLRFLDPANVYVGLKAKGLAKKDTSGFVVRPGEYEIRPAICPAGPQTCSTDPFYDTRKDPLTDAQYAQLLAIDEFETRDYRAA